MSVRTLFIGLLLAAVHLNPVKAGDRNTAPLLFPPPVFSASVTPSSGPTSGGARVTIQGQAEVPANSEVRFGTEFGVVEQISGGTIIVTTPPHLPGTVLMFLYRGGLSDPSIQRITATFTYEGDVPETYERLLLPIFVPPVPGAFGSVFQTELRVGLEDLGLVSLFGLRESGINSPSWDYIQHPFNVTFPGSDPSRFNYEGTPGRFIYSKASEIASFGANLRVRDVTRSALNFGTEIPIVRSREFVVGPIILQGVPTDSGFRNTLRIYSDRPTVATVIIEGDSLQSIRLNGPATIFEPTYASIPISPETRDFEPQTFSVWIDAAGDAPIWAFISVTNNDTQMITTITPQP